LAAHDLGYGTCYCGTYTDEAWTGQIKKWLNVPEHVEMYGLIVIGTPLKNKDVPERFDESKIHYNVW
jgi:nitroreductase